MKNRTGIKRMFLTLGGYGLRRPFPVLMLNQQQSMKTSYRDIAEEIIQVAMGNYAAWRIGFTHHPDLRKASWASRGYNVSNWQQFLLEEQKEAWYLYQYFSRNCGMLRDRPTDLKPNTPVYLYIF